MTPRTLDALRSAVARVLTARGEAPDTLRVTCGVWPNGRHFVRAETLDGRYHRLSLAPVNALGDDEAEAVGEAWRAMVQCLAVDAKATRDEVVRLASLVSVAESRAHTAADALAAAARAVEAIERESVCALLRAPGA